MSADDQTAGERVDAYVLGLLDDGDRIAFEAQMESDPALQAAVGACRDRFLALDLTADPQMPAEGLWSRIADRLDATPATADEEPRANPTAVNDNAAGGWRRTALAALAASLLLAIGLGWSLMQRPQPVVIAILVNEANEPQVVIEDYGNASARVIPLAAFEVPDGQTMEVWTKPSDEIGPVSLGLLARSETMVLEGPELPGPQPDQLYEITLEQAGGSPTGLPTGPILVKGFARTPL